MESARELPRRADVDWAQHRRGIKQSRGTVCFGALVVHYGTESPRLLEELVDGRKPYRAIDEWSDDLSISNKYRNWRSGKALPSDDTMERIARQTGGTVDLKFWRDLPLWELAAHESPSPARLNELLESSPREIRKILFLESRPDHFGRFAHAKLERREAIALRDLRSLQAFLTLLCLARKSELFGDDQQHYLPAACAFDIFPWVLHAHPQLRYRWSGALFDCLKRIFWSRVYIGGISPEFPIERIKTALELLGRNPTAELKQMTGRS